MLVRKIILSLVFILGLNITVYGQTFNPGNLRVRTDATGALMTTVVPQTLPISAPTLFPNIRLRTDSTGALVVTTNGGAVPSTATKGDMIYASATNTYSNLNIGSADGAFLAKDTTPLPVWSTNLFYTSDRLETRPTTGFGSGHQNRIWWTYTNSTTGCYASYGPEPFSSNFHGTFNLQLLNAACNSPTGYDWNINGSTVARLTDQAELYVVDAYFGVGCCVGTGSAQISRNGASSIRYLHFEARSGAVWSSTNFANGTTDVGLFRSSAGKLIVNDSTDNDRSHARDLVVRHLEVQQDTKPTCATNCGTSPSFTGSDTGFTLTMGATGTPASGFVVTFNVAFPAAPACTVQMAKAGMVVGKLALTAVTTTTTVTVVTNGTDPANGDMYHFICIGPNS